MERTRSDKASCDGAAARSHSSGEPALQDILTGAPSWLGSAIIHALLFLLLCQITWLTGEREENNFVVDLNTTITQDVEKQPKVERPEIKPTQAPLPNPEIKGIAFDRDMGDLSDVLEFDVPYLTDTDDLHHTQAPIIKIALAGRTPAGDSLDIFSGRRPRGKVGPERGLGRPGDDIQEIVGMNWLARVQEPDGHWDSRKWGANQNCDAGVTGLALLAFLGHGETDREGKYKATVREALLWLEKRQASDGSFGERFYTQGICTMAVSEAYALTSRRGSRWRRMAQKAIDYSCANQNPNGGWDYNGNSPNRVDTSVTAWMVLAVKSGHAAKLHVPTTAIERIKRWLRESVNADYTTGYSKKIGAQGSSGGTPPMTAAATLCRIFMPESAQRGDIGHALAYLNKRGVDLNNLYYTYYATFVMHQARRVYPNYWREWRKAFRKSLIAKQINDPKSKLHGSWNTNVTYGNHGGRVYTTAMSILCLEVDYRYLSILRHSDL